MRTLLLTTLFIGALSGAAIGQTKYGVTATVDKKTDFSTLKTYDWSTGYAAFDKAVHQQIVAAIERELAALGFTKVTGPSDALIAYDAQQRTDVDLEAEQTADGMLPMYRVGTLVVRLLHPGDRREMFRARIDKPLEVDRNKLQQTVDEAVAAIFAKYPPRRPPGK